jgi:hypothetical protein
VHSTVPARATFSRKSGKPNIGAVNLFSTLADAAISAERTTSEQYFAKAIDSMAEAFRRSPCSPSLLAPGYRQCILEQKMTANLDTWPAFHSTGEDHPSLPLLPLCFCTTNVGNHRRRLSERRSTSHALK